MYQHDLSDKGIAERLRDVVEDCVNVVGVDVNSASADLLRYISGLTEGNVKEIIAHRTGADAAAAASNSAGKPSKSKTRKNSATQECANIGRINSLAELRAIKGIGPKTFRNCAGFLRVYGGPEPLDATNIHPEDYELARVMTKVYTRERQQKVKLAIMTENTGHDERKHKKAKKEAQEETVAMQLSSRHNSAETAAEASETVSFWARFSAESKTTAGESAKPASASSSELALLQGKSAAELEQIWAWLVEGGIVAEEPPTVTVSSTPGRGSGGSGGRGGQPYMSYPKVLQEVPRDFHATVAVGSVLKGVIRNVTTFGAFVDLGGVVIASPESSSSSSSSGAAREKAQGGKGKASCDGLLHCSKYRDFLNKRTAGQAQAGAASAEIYVGREVMVKIISIEETSDGQKASHDKRRISLDLVELL